MIEDNGLGSGGGNKDGEKWKDLRESEEAKLVGFGHRSAKQPAERLRAVLKISDLLNRIDSVHHNRKHHAQDRFIWGTGDVVLNIVVWNDLKRIK